MDRIDQGAEIQGQIRTLSASLDALRQRVDSELKLVHAWVRYIDAKEKAHEARIAQLEQMLSLSPEHAALVEVITR